MYNTVLFDLDGTITDSSCGILNSVEYALRKYGVSPPERENLYFFIGPPLDASFAKLLGITLSDANVLVEYYREYYRETGIFENHLYEGVEQLLRDIKNSGRKIVLATSKPEEFALKILSHFKIDKYFDIIAGATFDGTRSEKAEVIAYAMGKAGITDITTCVMVGDRKYDCIGAAHLGIDSIGVLYGFGSLAELTAAGAKYIAGTPKDIFKFL